MGHKVLVTWNSHPEHENRLFHHVREFVNRLSPLGLELTDAWYTVYGDAPQILLGFVPRKDQDDQLQAIVTSEEWAKILVEFKDFVTDYEQRVVQATKRFQF
jgi:hypothetical protein